MESLKVNIKESTTIRNSCRIQYYYEGALRNLHCSDYSKRQFAAALTAMCIKCGEDPEQFLDSIQIGGEDE